MSANTIDAEFARERLHFFIDNLSDERIIGLYEFVKDEIADMEINADLVFQLFPRNEKEKQLIIELLEKMNIQFSLDSHK